MWEPRHSFDAGRREFVPGVGQGDNLNPAPQVIARRPSIRTIVSM